MKNFQEQLRRLIGTVKLTDFERADMRARVTEYMEHLPLSPIQGGMTQSHHVLLSSRLLVSAFAAFVIVVSGSVSFAAEGSYPGDFLYPVKIYINEGVEGSLSFSSEDKLAWRVERLERRLDEVVTLVSRDEYRSSEKEAMLSQLSAQTETLNDTFVALESEELPLVISARAEAEASLGAYQELLGHLVADNEERGEEDLEDFFADMNDITGIIHKVDEDGHVAKQADATLMTMELGVELPSVVQEGGETESRTFEAQTGVDVEPSSDTYLYGAEEGEVSAQLARALKRRLERVLALVADVEGVLSSQELQEVEKRVESFRKEVGHFTEGPSSAEEVLFRELVSTGARLEVYLRTISRVGADYRGLNLDILVPRDAR